MNALTPALVCSALLLGSAFPASGSERGLRRVEEPPPAPVTLWISFETGEGPARRLLASGDSLRSRERFRIRVRSSAAVYLYLLQFFADGTANLLHPEGKDTRLELGGELDILLELDDHAGEEHLYVVASVQPLAEVDEAVSQRIEEVRVSGGGTPVSPDDGPSVAPPRPAPQTAELQRRRSQSAAEPPQQQDFLGLGTRGVVRVRPDNSLEALADHAGVTIYHFWLRHLPAR